MSDAIQHSNSQADRIQNGFDHKELVPEEFSYLHPAATQQGYGIPANEQYIPSYYGQMHFPYMGEWSTAGESVPYLSGYNSVGNGEPHHSLMQDAMFSQTTGGLGNGQTYFNPPVFQHGNEFTAWTSPSVGHSTSLDSRIGHQNATNPNDFYSPVMPPVQQDYLGRSDMINPTNNIGNMAVQNVQGGLLSSGMSGGDGGHKMSSSPMKIIDQGMHSLTISNMGGNDPLNSKSTITQGGTNMGNVDAAVVHQMPSKLSSVNNAPSMPPVSKPVSWAAIASKPAKPQPKPKTKPTVGPGLPPPIKHNMDIGNWDNSKIPPRAETNIQMVHPSATWTPSRPVGYHYENGIEATLDLSSSERDKEGQKENNTQVALLPTNPVLEKLKMQNEYNPKRLTMDLRNSRFFVIKSYSEDDIHRSIKYNIWCSTEHGNKRLDATFRAQKNRGPVILLYSVNGSGHFCGVAEMKTCVDYSSRAGVWSQDKWKGKFQVKWIYVKDVPNTVLRHIRLENNDNKPVTNSRDTQEVPADKGRQVLKIIANYKHQTSIFDDFGHYERRQQEEENVRNKAAQSTANRERKPVGEFQQAYTRK